MCLMSLIVGVATAVSLGALSVDLWLVFGLLAFWLNFIPNVGTVLAVALPMPARLVGCESKTMTSRTPAGVKYTCVRRGGAKFVFVPRQKGRNTRTHLPSKRHRQSAGMQTP